MEVESSFLSRDKKKPLKWVTTALRAPKTAPSSQTRLELCHLYLFCKPVQNLANKSLRTPMLLLVVIYPLRRCFDRSVYVIELSNGIHW